MAQQNAAAATLLSCACPQPCAQSAAARPPQPRPLYSRPVRSRAQSAATNRLAAAAAPTLQPPSQRPPFSQPPMLQSTPQPSTERLNAQQQRQCGRGGRKRRACCETSPPGAGAEPGQFGRSGCADVALAGRKGIRSTAMTWPDVGGGPGGSRCCSEQRRVALGDSSGHGSGNGSGDGAGDGAGEGSGCAWQASTMRFTSPPPRLVPSMLPPLKWMSRTFSRLSFSFCAGDVACAGDASVTWHARAMFQ